MSRNRRKRDRNKGSENEKENSKNWSVKCSCRSSRFYRAPAFNNVTKWHDIPLNTAPDIIEWHRYYNKQSATNTHTSSNHQPLLLLLIEPVIGQGGTLTKKKKKK